MNTIHSLQSLDSVLSLPNGARFYRCALQVNPFDYVKRYAKPTDIKTEKDYNAKIVEACKLAKVEVIAVTDHFRVQHSKTLVDTARKAGLYAFCGFEAVTKDGVHLLCLFDPAKDKDLPLYLGECQIGDSDEPSQTGGLDSGELLARSKEWGAVCIAPHVTFSGGLLKKLSGHTRMNVWKSPDLLACAIPGSIDDTPNGIRNILKNKDKHHRRDHMLAVLNASDVNDPNDFKKDSTSCFIKMSSVSVEALRQAFLDPESRIRLNTDPKPEPHAELLTMNWEGGFLNGTLVRFNENLNVLVGGRGTGKSTIIESIRYVFGMEPLGDDACNIHRGVIQNVLQTGTKISLRIRSHKPSRRDYLIERTVPNPPVVKNEIGEILNITPEDLMPGIEIFGQHEISELTKDRKKLLALLKRFIDGDPSLPGKKLQLRLDLEQSRNRIVEIHKTIWRLQDRLTGLPGLEETLKRFQEAGLEEKLKEKSLMIREERLFTRLHERLEPFHTSQRELVNLIPIDSTFVSSKALSGLPNADTLKNLEGILSDLSDKLTLVCTDYEKALKDTETAVLQIKTLWSESCALIDKRYEKLLRSLQKSKIDGDEFIQLRRQIEELRPLRDQTEKLRRELDAQNTRRNSLLLEWEDIQAKEFQQFQQAAKKVSRRLRNQVKVDVKMSGNRDPLEELLRQLGGNLSHARSTLRSLPQLSLRDLAQKCREGKDSLMQHYGLTSANAERLANANADWIMRIEELELQAIPKVSLNTSPAENFSNWQTLGALSTGQKATAVLLLLLLESETPLIIDQPEDDLDNRFIADGIVPVMRREKRCRQFVFSTHNANIPVLGDAELILGLTTNSDQSQLQASIPQEYMGSIDSTSVRELIEEILEGGKVAFETRRTKYGY